MKFNLMAVFTAVGLLSACAASLNAGSDSLERFMEAHRIPQEKIDEARKFMQQGIPFHIEISPDGAIGDGELIASSELANLKKRFLTPIAGSPHPAKIKSVKIDASGREWQGWSCVIELEDHVGPISLTRYASLYNGLGNSDPDGYKASRRYVLSELHRLSKLARGNEE